MHLSTSADAQAVMPLVVPLIVQCMADVAKLPPEQRAPRINRVLRGAERPMTWILVAGHSSIWGIEAAPRRRPSKLAVSAICGKPDV